MHVHVHTAQAKHMQAINACRQSKTGRCPQIKLKVKLLPLQAFNSTHISAIVTAH